MRELAERSLIGTYLYSQCVKPDIRGEFNNASAFKRSLYWCQALHNMNKDRYQSTSARRALALLNSPQDNERLKALALLNSSQWYTLHTLMNNHLIAISASYELGVSF